MNSPVDILFPHEARQPQQRLDLLVVGALTGRRLELGQANPGVVVTTSLSDGGGDRIVDRNAAGSAGGHLVVVVAVVGGRRRKTCDGSIDSGDDRGVGRPGGRDEKVRVWEREGERNRALISWWGTLVGREPSLLHAARYMDRPGEGLGEVDDVSVSRIMDCTYSAGEIDPRLPGGEPELSVKENSDSLPVNVLVLGIYSVRRKQLTTWSELWWLWKV